MSRPEVIRLDLPVRGSGYTLRHNRWRRPEYGEYPSDGGRIWLFQEPSQIHDFLASEVWPAPYWRELFADAHEDLDLRDPLRLDLWCMVDGPLRWSSEPVSPCNALLVELAFCCESSELLDLLAPDFKTADPRVWRRILSILVPMIRIWGDPDEPLASDAVAESIKACFAGSFRDGSYRASDTMDWLKARVECATWHTSTRST